MLSESEDAYAAQLAYDELMEDLAQACENVNFAFDFVAGTDVPGQHPLWGIVLNTLIDAGFEPQCDIQ